MTSKSPVPSRAALNALRGVLFTTSCSVFLLAEERRRRLNIARAAIENARKLHTVRSNRGAIALTADVVDEIVPPPFVERPLKNSHRRRRRDDLTNHILHDPDFEIHRHGTDYRKLEAKIQEAQADAVGAKAELASSRSHLPQPLHRDVGFRPLQFLAPATLSHGSRVRSHKRRANKQDGVVGLASPESAQSPLTSTPIKPDGPQLPYEQTLANLRSLLEDLGRHDETTPAHTLGDAIASLRELVHLQPSTPILDDILKFEGLELLKRAVELDRSRVPGILKVLCFRMKDSPSLLGPFVRWLQERNDVQGFEELLEHLRGREQSWIWVGGMLLYRLFSARSKLDGHYEQTKGLYGMFLEAGLFDKIAVPRKTEYRIRRLMFTRALDAGDEAFAQDEMRVICGLEPDLSKSDVKVQGALLTHAASCGRWDAVRAGLVALTQVVDAESRYFGRLLVEITDMFAKVHTADELENLLRGLADHYRIPMKHRWVQRILDGHASRREIGKMLSWLQFCSDHGLKVDDQFIESYVANCRKYLSLSEATVAKLYQTIGRPMPALPTPERPTPDRARSPEGQAPDGSLPDPEHWASRADALAYMQSLEAHEEWGRLIEAYTKFQQSGLGFSQDILRLAVLGCIRGGKSANGDDGDVGEKGAQARIEQASALIVEARDQGHSVAGALTPLLIARLDEGDDPGALIKSALQNGVKVHNSVYSKAAQRTLARGDVEGAAQLCRLAARENGGRRLVYSEGNFLNLVGAYMSSARHYGALRDVVARFTEGVDWWKGSQRCKMGIKLAMKTAAMRAAVNPAGRGAHEEVLFALDEALVHVRRCRVVVGERQAVKDALVRVVRGKEEEEEEGEAVMPQEEEEPRIAEVV